MVNDSNTIFYGATIEITWIYHQSKSWGPKSVWFPLVELSSQGVLEL